MRVVTDNTFLQHPGYSGIVKNSTGLERFPEVKRLLVIIQLLFHICGPVLYSIRVCTIAG